MTNKVLISNISSSLLKILNSSVSIPKLVYVLPLFYRISTIQENEGMISVIGNLIVPGLPRGNLRLR